MVEIGNPRGEISLTLPLNPMTSGPQPLFNRREMDSA